MNKIGIIGGGVWGSALAKLLSGNKVLIYARDKNIVSSINEHRINPKLKYVIFNDNVRSTSNIKDLHNYDYIFLALPSQNIREVMKEYNNKNKNQNIIIASKGIEIQSKKVCFKFVIFLNKSFIFNLGNAKIFRLRRANNVKLL